MQNKSLGIYIFSSLLLLKLILFLNGWLWTPTYIFLQAIFERFDRDRSGKIDSSELRDALLSIGYAVPPSVLQVLVSKYNDGKTGKGALSFDSFVE